MRLLIMEIKTNNHCSRNYTDRYLVDQVWDSDFLILNAHDRSSCEYGDHTYCSQTEYYDHKVGKSGNWVQVEDPDSCENHRTQGDQFVNIK